MDGVIFFDRCPFARPDWLDRFPCGSGSALTVPHAFLDSVFLPSRPRGAGRT